MRRLNTKIVEICTHNSECWFSSIARVLRLLLTIHTQDSNNWASWEDVARGIPSGHVHLEGLRTCDIDLSECTLSDKILHALKRQDLSRITLSGFADTFKLAQRCIEDEIAPAVISTLLFKEVFCRQSTVLDCAAEILSISAALEMIVAFRKDVVDESPCPFLESIKTPSSQCTVERIREHFRSTCLTGPYLGIVKSIVRLPDTYWMSLQVFLNHYVMTDDAARIADGKKLMRILYMRGDQWQTEIDGNTTLYRAGAP